MQFVLAALMAAASMQSEGWTFCVAEHANAVWISDVFAPMRAREKLETDFKAWLLARGVEDADVQCPAPYADKTEAFNAQFVAAEFHRKLGQPPRTVDWSGRER